MFELAIICRWCSYEGGRFRDFNCITLFCFSRPKILTGYQLFVWKHILIYHSIVYVSTSSLVISCLRAEYSHEKCAHLKDYLCHFFTTKLPGDNLSRVMRKPTFWFPTWSDTNQAVRLQKTARGLKFRI